MIEIVLVGVIIVLSGLLIWSEHNNRKERKSLINALLSKTNEELVNLELADKTKVEVKPQEEKEDLIDLNTLSNKEYEEKVING